MLNMPFTGFSGEIRLDEASIRLVRGNRTLNQYRNAVKLLKPLIQDKPVDLEVYSVTRPELGGHIDRDEAVLILHPQTEQEKRQEPFVRQYGWLFSLEHPKTFLTRILRGVLNEL